MRKAVIVLLALAVIFLSYNIGFATNTELTPNTGAFAFADKFFILSLPGEIPILSCVVRDTLETSSDPQYFYVNRRFGFLRFRPDGAYCDIFMFKSRNNLYPFLLRAFMKGNFRYWYYHNNITFEELTYKEFLKVMAPICADSRQSCERRGIKVIW